MHTEEIKLDIYLSYKRKDSELYKNLTRAVNFESRTLITIVCHITIFVVIIAIDVSIQNNDNEMRNYLNF